MSPEDTEDPSSSARQPDLYRPGPADGEDRAPLVPQGGTVLLTGATGFVGQALYPALREAGYAVRCASRDPIAAASRYPDRDWVGLDVHAPATLAPALEGCHAAIYLIHGIGEGDDYAAREVQGARAFRLAAEAAGVERIVYLGGVAPRGSACSRHLRSRLRTGEELRAGTVSTVELRAGMIVGAGSASWKIVIGLARRLPAMILPRWLQRSSWPIPVASVVQAIVHAVGLPRERGGFYDLPGPERLTHQAMLERAAAALGKDPWMVDVPVLSPALSSYWISGVTGVRLSLVQELVAGLQGDLEPTGPDFWERTGLTPASDLDTAIAAALAEEEAGTQEGV